MLLDPIVEVARAVADDCAKRPREYRHVPEKILTTLSDFRTLTGSHPDWLSGAQRASIYAPLFDGQFRRAGAELRAAATRSGLGTSKEREALRQTIRDASSTLRAWLTTADGPVVSSANHSIGRGLDAAIEVFRSDDVARVFGLASPTSRDWPLGGDLNWEAAALVAAAGKAVGLSHYARLLDANRLLQLQRIGFHGAAALEAALSDSGTDEGVTRLARTGNSWNSGLSALRRLGVVDDGSGGTLGRDCLFWLCEDVLICGFLPGRWWPTCFWAEICICWVYAP
jgi:hypothetical protein